jgi:hypothetical protein
MKSKVHYQVQPRPVIAASREPIPVVHARAGTRVEDEIQKFFQAIDSYSARAAKEPGVTFHQHLRSVFTTGDGSHRQTARARQL